MLNYFLLASIVCITTFAFFIPFINFLYKIKMQDPIRAQNRIDRFGHTVEVFDSIKAMKVGTPTGGGVLIVMVTGFIFLLLYLLNIYNISSEKFTLIISTFLFFGILGFFDDVKKVFKIKGLALRVRHKLLLQLAGALFISYYAISNKLFFVNIPFSDLRLDSGILLYILSISSLVFISNAFNILDGIDGLSSGSLLITIVALIFFVFGSTGDAGDLTFLFVLFGASLAYLYFNINPARIFMGDTGALAFGAIIGLMFLTTGAFFLLPIAGFIYIIDALSSLLQWASMILRNGKRIFKIAPLHHHFEAIGWESTKVVFRFWVIHVFMTLLAMGLFWLVD
ncbi:hypothetical protein A2V49_04190 [candidate division WWE3 bacterium RBG_19FT_COMBO_34_6]|uniref:Phospho-N-acetylmuramoyl-pentapeptide-transferase n=1 Tax=candidate division WWE3 bacterium RBG_19FT_COMBO_34_6 TaxID=1802612 RepID=A0A1F4UNV9_UNCKA|nr:MAG: hypothetical protein A2V49_04190 [candidate division WWE3 bacterium RBG_19FT_COMBO_34_6]